MYSPRKRERLSPLEEVSACLDGLSRNAQLLWMLRAYVDEPICRDMESILDLIKVRLDTVKKKLSEKDLYRP